MKKTIPFFLLFLFLNSCQPSEIGSSKNENLPFFDLKTYFKGEKERLGTLSNIKKTTIVNRKKEEKQVEQLNLDQELRIFEESDINRPAWHGKYRIDSIYQENKLTQVAYVPKDLDLDIRLIRINYENNTLSKIEIDRKLTTALANTSYNLHYQPEKGYSIFHTQDMKIGDLQTFEVHVEF